MPEETARNIRIPVRGQEGKHTGHKIRTINVSVEKGIKALYCVVCKKIITYIFAKNKEWTMASAKQWVQGHKRKLKSMSEVVKKESLDLVYIEALLISDDGAEILEKYEPNSEEFVLVPDIEEFTLGLENKDENEDDIEKSVTAYQDLPMAEKDKAWDASEAKKRIAEWAKGEEETDWEKYQKAFFYYDPDNKEKALGYKLPYADIVDGKLQAIPKAVISVVGAIAGTRGGVNIPDGEKKKILDQCKKYYKKMDMEFPDVTIKEKNEDQDNDVEEFFDVIKVDKRKQIIYGIFLVPEKADHDGDVISEQDVEKVAHGFIRDYRDIDEMHNKTEILNADIVESSIAWDDGIGYYGKKLKRGTWFGAVKVNDKDVWEKIENGEYKGFSVRISGRRIPIEEDKLKLEDVV